MSQTRRLAAILAADMAAYSRLMGADEGGTLRQFRAIRAELIDPMIAALSGRLVKTTGDGLLVEFGSVVDALRCATELQAGMAERNAEIAADQRIEFRIGINVGDVVVPGSPAGSRNPGSYVELRAERNVLAVLSNCPQTCNPCNGYNPTPIRVVIYKPLAAPESV